MNEVKIRRAAMADIPLLKVFEQGVIETERPFDSTLKDGHFLYYGMEEMINADNVELLVASIDELVIGSGYARIVQSKPYHKYQQYAYLGFMYVLPEHRGKGVNSLIINGLKAWADSKNVTELRLQVYVENAPAINAYEKVGFSKTLVEMRLGTDDKS